MKKITQDWLNSAKDDFKIIKLIISDITLTHQVAFHAQQAIEKILKAVIEEFEIGSFKTHSLKTLIHIISEKVSINTNEDLILLLEQLYIDARYPGELGLLPNGKPTIEEVRKFVEMAKNIYSEVERQLNKKQ